ncbi:MAG: hypothetical protein ACJASZ_002939 [Yoonia sp.]|jgi:hypothetical protein
MWRSAYPRYMRQLAPAILVLSLAVSPAFAQERPDIEPEEGFSLMEEGAQNASAWADDRDGTSNQRSA